MGVVHEVKKHWINDLVLFCVMVFKFTAIFRFMLTDLPLLSQFRRVMRSHINNIDLSPIILCDLQSRLGLVIIFFWIWTRFALPVWHR